LSFVTPEGSLSVEGTLEILPPTLLFKHKTKKSAVAMTALYGSVFRM
jgi:hypothetical protein